MAKFSATTDRFGTSFRPPVRCPDDAIALTCTPSITMLVAPMKRCAQWRVRTRAQGSAYASVDSLSGCHPELSYLGVPLVASPVKRTQGSDRNMRLALTLAETADCGRRTVRMAIGPPRQPSSGCRGRRRTEGRFRCSRAYATRIGSGVAPPLDRSQALELSTSPQLAALLQCCEHCFGV